MKKKIFIVLLFVTFIGLIIILFINKKEEEFYLEDKYYVKGNLTEIEIKDLDKLVDNKESFAVFIYQPLCLTSSDFESVLKSFLEEEQINVYKLAYQSIKETKLGKKIKYYPSFIIYKDGKIVDFLEANKDEDVEFYSSKEGFKKWFTKYVKLKDRNNNLIKDEQNDDFSFESITIDNVVEDKNKVNIYFFWGDGCPHCEEEKKFLDSIKDSYGNLFNLYTFEVWYNEDNAKILDTFKKAMKDKRSGVPYTVIGDVAFSGFGSSSKEEFLKTIREKSQEDSDIYFDKVKAK